MNKVILLLTFTSLLCLIASSGCSKPDEDELQARRNAAMRAQLQEANQLLAGGSSDEAILLLEVARGDYPGQPDVLESLAFAYQSAGQHDLAGDLFEAALLADPSRSELAVFAAHSFLQASDVDGAIRMYTAHLQNDPNDAFAWRSIAELYQQENRLRPALDAYLKSINTSEADQVDAATALEIARLYLALGNTAQAKDWVEQARQHETGSSSAELELLRFDLALREQNWNQAIQIMEELDRSHPIEFQNSSLYANREPLQQWVSNQQRLKEMRIDPTAPTNAQEPSEAPSPSPATPATDLANDEPAPFPPKVPTDPLPPLTLPHPPSTPATPPPPPPSEPVDDAAPFNKIPEVPEPPAMEPEAQPTEPAEVVAEPLPKIPLVETTDDVPAPTPVVVITRRPGLIGDADELRDQGHYTDAMQLYLRAAGQNDRIATPWYEISRIYALQGKYQEAELTALEAIRRDPADPALTLNLLNVLQHSASGQRFMREVIKAREQHPDNPDITFAAARAYEYIGKNPRSARFLYQDFLNKASDAHPKRGDAEQALRRLLNTP